MAIKRINIKWTKRKVMIATGAALALICILFSIPFFTVPYATSQTYEAIEYEQEAYTAVEPYTSVEIRDHEEIVFQGTPYSVPNGILIPVSVEKAGTRLVGSYWLPASGGLYIYSAAGSIFYEQMGNAGDVDIPLPEGNYKVLVRERNLWGVKVSIDLRLNWSEEEEVTEYKEVTRYRDRPVTVKKTRDVVSEKKSSLWGIIFGLN